MIALSNLAIPRDAALPLLERLAADGLRGVEVAPTRLAPWDALTPAMVQAHRAELAALGLAVPSLQAILFGVEGVALLEGEEAFERLLEHLRRVAGIAQAFGAGVAVFGSPRQRSRGALPEAEAFALGAARLRRCAEACWEEGRLALGLEPVPAAYGGDFLPTWQECLAMVETVSHPGLRLHLDTGCVRLGGGDIAEAIAAGRAVLAHFHAAEPGLAGFAAPVAAHAEAAQALRAAGYAGWVSLEMREDPDWRALVPQAVAFVRDTYEA